MVAVVETRSGKLAGKRIEGEAPLTAFLGIPFAAPPVGPLRWRPPQPAPSWAGVRGADAFGPDPLQAPTAELRGRGLSEDCLTLNIWVPEDAGGAGGALPVMVWLFGGSFVYGSGSSSLTDPAPLTRQRAVLVTVNYRLGLFGYLAHPALTAESPQRSSGNYGLLDQIAALAWVRDNIAAFGGDPSRITLFGNSAGGASIGLLLTSPLADGLFHQAILQSPGSLRPLATLAQAEEHGRALGEDIEALRTLPAEELLARTGRLTAGPRGLTTPRLLRPFADGWVVPGDERAAYRDGRFSAMPMIIGNMAAEGRFFGSLGLQTAEQYRRYVERNFAAAAESALAAYPAGHPGATPAAVAEQVEHLFGDTQFNFGVRGIARANARRGQPTFRYLFAHPADDMALPPTHTDEIPYVFGNKAADAALSAAMMGAWVRFAATGDPNGGGLPDWPACDAHGEPALQLAWPMGLVDGWRRPQLDFLERYFAATS
jgi:carboxylesterase type B